MRPSVLALLIIGALAAFSGPALAGGWAAVHLDAAPGDVPVDTPWRFGFMVLQHDVTPNSDVTPIVRATHKETGEEVTATGRQEGPAGHFVAEITFPRAGDWKWAIHPEPYAETSFETLHVVAPAAAALAHPAAIVTGSCSLPQESSFALGDVVFSAGDASSRTPVAVAAATIDAPLATLVASAHAISVTEDAKSPQPIACGDLAGTIAKGEVVVGLQPWRDSGIAGIGLLRQDGERTAVTLYLLRIAAPGTPDTISSAASIDILDAMAFQPSALDVTPGTTVTWVNRSPIAHTVTGDALAFDDSGLLAPGQSYSLTFDVPGVFRYHCGPHPDMTGVVTVA